VRDADDLARVCEQRYFVNADKKINTEPADRQLYELLRGYVTRK
jgi:hypothetical protein